jgi:hypothetical protein
MEALRRSAEFPGDADAVAIAEEVFRKKLDSRLTDIRQNVTRIVPCFIFDVDQHASAFKVGPVAFYAQTSLARRHEFQLSDSAGEGRVGGSVDDG